MKTYMSLFGQKTDDDYIRHWVGISTEIYKDGKGTGKYANASIQARVSEDVEKLYKENAAKTKTKGIKLVRLEVTEYYPMAARPKDKDAKDYVYLYIKSAKIAESKDDDEEDEDD